VVLLLLLLDWWVVFLEPDLSVAKGIAVRVLPVSEQEANVRERDVWRMSCVCAMGGIQCLS
jgi:hypothetical protein